jgi:tetratricopeptide (TPR) repeat protein
MLEMIVLLAAAPAPVAAANPQPIVVVGERIKDARGKLQACIARNCPPNEEIDAALALAEIQLVSGEYRDARSTLLRSLKRNKDEAKRYPIPVSDLYRANGKVAAHLGYDQDYYRSTFGIYHTLKNGLPSEDSRKYSALMEVAEMNYRTRGHERARIYYDLVAKRARADGRPDIAAIAELRSAIRHLPPGSTWQLSAINRIAGLQGKEMRAPVLEARLALARMAFEKKDEQRAQAVLQELASLNIKRPILIYSPPFNLPDGPSSPGEASRPTGYQNTSSVVDAETGNRRTARNLESRGPSTFATNHMAINVEDEWMDVGFRITPEGRVADLKVLRRSGDNGWAPPLLASIAGRRYTPGKDNHPASTRIERYTYTSALEKGASTRVAVHSPKARIEYLDLSSMGIGAPD